MNLPTKLQLLSVLLFIHGAWLYYGIRRLLHSQGYPVSIFVYSGSCWPHYDHLIASSDPKTQSRLKRRKLIMALSFIGALLLLVATSLATYIV